MSQPNRVETMAEKLAVYAARAGVPDTRLILDAYRLAIRPRVQLLSDVFHHDLLHPARTALILIEQANCANATVVAAAELIETHAPELRVDADEIGRVLGQTVADLAAQVPDPAQADAALLLEQLVSVPDDVALIALAERLDHARHLHLREPRLWRPYFEETTRIYLPVAQRASPELHRRFARWAHAFGKRL